MHVETNIFADKNYMTLDLSEQTTHITVYNNKKLYNLLSSVVHKQKVKKDGNKLEIHH